MKAGFSVSCYTSKTMKETVKNFLKENNIEYTLHKHIAVYTCDDLGKADVPGMTLKNLFLREKKNEQYYLVTLPASGRLDMKRMKELIGSKHVSFGKPDALMEKLGIDPGSVSPLCLLNNKERDVKLFLHREGWEAEMVNVHPNDNTASLSMSQENFHKLVEVLGSPYEIYD